MMFSSNAFRFVLVLAAAFNANAETVRGAQRELSTTAEVDLGTAEDYVILTKAGISSAGSTIAGDIAVSPIAATAMTGFGLTLDTGTGRFAEASQLGSNKAFAADYAVPTPANLVTAVSDMETAYTDASGRPNGDGARTNVLGGKIGGEVLTPGVYTFGSDVLIGSNITFQGTTTLSGPTDVFIIQMTGSLTLADRTHVLLTNGVKAKNIVWQVAKEVLVKSAAVMQGTLLVKTKVVFKEGSALTGRVLAQTRCDLEDVSITEPPN
jgi:hypothetical protein